jgi:hypothetical protein
VRSAFGLPPGAPHTRLPLTRTGLIALGVLLAACTSQGSPATTPATVATTLATSTTLDRLAEVEAIVQDLEERRLDALYRKDLEALREVYASESLYERNKPVLGQLKFEEPPWVVTVQISDILVDRQNCLALVASFDDRDALGPEAFTEETVVLQPTDSGSWGFAYSGEGWLCRGPNPLELEE